MIKRKAKLTAEQEQILELQEQIQEEMSYFKKLQMKFLKNKENWFKYGKNYRPYWLYLGGKIEKPMDDNAITNRQYLNDNRHFLKDPVVQELEQTRSSIGHKQEMIKALEGKMISYTRYEDEEEYEDE